MDNQNSVTITEFISNNNLLFSDEENISKNLILKNFEIFFENNQRLKELYISLANNNGNVSGIRQFHKDFIELQKILKENLDILNNNSKLLDNLLDSLKTKEIKEDSEEYQTYLKFKSFLELNQNIIGNQQNLFNESVGAFIHGNKILHLHLDFNKRRGLM